MFAAIISVIGTLLGALAVGGLQHLAKCGERELARQTELRDAASLLLDGATDHRSHQYLKHVAVREGRPDTPEARQARYEAQSQMTKGLNHIEFATADARIRQLASDLVTYSKEIGNHPSEDYDAVNASGEMARSAATALRRAVADRLHH
ncbi:hypothetical protein [Streptomyces acidiscabies]|uniref:hypothetical protein n=1 Tax=Streptomyces acidiscabies TaxID=42234 RepID=UPI000E688CEB|nr:hypothetical protein [Streptomyces acidiscabies]MBP5942595.1 hypothetical protein [Streptomyces sp. LBUM 1476]